MPEKLNASELYRQGRFNVANITVAEDGTTTITCSGVKAPGPYTFRARHFLTDRQELLDDPAIAIADVGAPLAAPPEG